MTTGTDTVRRWLAGRLHHAADRLYTPQVTIHFDTVELANLVRVELDNQRVLERRLGGMD